MARFSGVARDAGGFSYIGVVVVLALTHRYNAVRGHLTGYNNSGVEDYLRRKINNYSLRVTSLRYYRHTHHCKGSHLLLCIYTYFVWLYRTYMMQGLKLGGEILRWRIFVENWAF